MGGLVLLLLLPYLRGSLQHMPKELQVLQCLSRGFQPKLIRHKQLCKPLLPGVSGEPGQSKALSRGEGISQQPLGCAAAQLLTETGDGAM